MYAYNKSCFSLVIFVSLQIRQTKFKDVVLRKNVMGLSNIDCSTVEICITKRDLKKTEIDIIQNRNRVSVFIL